MIYALDRDRLHREMIKCARLDQDKDRAVRIKIVQ